MDNFKENRKIFYEKFLEFDFTSDGANQFFVNWYNVVGEKENMTPATELEDLEFLLEKTKGDGDLANNYMQDILSEGKEYGIKSWNEFISQIAEMQAQK